MKSINVSTIEIKGARVNNLKNVSLSLPRNKFIVITGLSGSGKSSLAFDTLYAEGQRRYVESLSAYARQFLGRMHKPECDYIKGLPPAIAIEQKVTARNPRSTVGTSTEIYDYLRLLFARVGRTYSPVSGCEVRRDTPDDVVNCLLQYSQGTRFTILAPIVKAAGRTLHEQLEIFLKEGLSRVDIDGEIVRIEDVPQQVDGDIYLLIDRMSVDSSRDALMRLTDSVETAFFEGGGECLVRVYPSRTLHRFSVSFEADGMKFTEPDDNMFSFNSPVGACPTCEGFGRVMGIDEALVVPNSTLSVYDGAVVCWRGEKMGLWREEFCRRAERTGFPIFTPYYKLTREQKDLLWHGDRTEQSLPQEEQVTIDAFFRMLESNQYKIQYRVMLARYRGKTTCPTCRGHRLKPEADYVKVAGHSITELVTLPVTELLKVFREMVLPEHDAKVADRLLTEIRTRLAFLVDVGLGYLTLDRLSNSLSGGESQRINLATSLGSALVGSLYILDEPSIGLHSRDTLQLISVLKQLRDLGNTVIVVEHDEEIMRAADYIVDIGPEAGRHGGEVVWQGEARLIPEAVHLPAARRSHTLQYLAGTDEIPVPEARRAWNCSLTVRGARANNLKGLDVTFPLNVFTVVTGVSGSGKSTLVNTILYRALKRHFDEVAERPGEYLALEGDLRSLCGVEFVDQNPIGKSTRSNPATYVKAYDEIRKLMAEQPLSKQMGFTPAYFSFNTPGGRCEECKGEGTVKVEMQFMADLVLECEACGGKRFKGDVLEVRYHGQNIADILDMTVNRAIEFFGGHGDSKIVERLRPLQDVGLGYIKLGQSSSTLSGGENQRVKLAYYLSLENSRPTLFIFDEPTTGLHFHDIRRLLSSFNALIEKGHSVLVIEHNMDVVKCADHVIDLGPEGGRAGGRLVVAGTPEEVAKAGRGYTARFLAEKLARQ
ncbi:MAG: excinuclease ABC subunit UvrA [Bacteroidales bacterium]|nr:excinuclease ABC subunit UvrA [Bacteroidales bacterium]